MSMLNRFLPVKEVEVYNNDKEWMNPQLKTLFSKRENAFQCKDKPLWRRLRNKINRMIMYNKNRYYNTRVSHLKTTNPSAWYKQIKIITKGNSDSPVIKVQGIAGNDPKCYEKTANAINMQFISITKDIEPCTGQVQVTHFFTFTGNMPRGSTIRCVQNTSKYKK